MLTHYDPDYSDAMVDALAARARGLLDDHGGGAIRLTAASEGLTITL